MLNKEVMDVYKVLLKKEYEDRNYSIWGLREWNLMSFIRLYKIIKHDLEDKDKQTLDEYVNTELIPMTCPNTGSFVAYKKCLMKSKDKRCIVKLQIPSDAKRSSAFGTKCRCDKAEVLDIWNPSTGKHLKTAISSADKNFVYRVGETVEVDDFDEDRFNECSHGIHFFMTEEEARNYQL